MHARTRCMMRTRVYYIRIRIERDVVKNRTKRGSASKRRSGRNREKGGNSEEGVHETDRNASRVGIVSKQIGHTTSGCKSGCKSACSL